jgi:tetratricopeptide (TPR) repeat protein
MSPEHFVATHSEDLDERADIYSLGIVLYELLNPKCRPPFDGSYSQLRDLHLRAAAPRLPEATGELSGVVVRCLDKDRAGRYQSVWELLEDLERIQGTTDSPAVSYGKTEPTQTDKLDETWNAASVCYSRGEFEEAARLVNELLASQPNHSEAIRIREELRRRFAQSEQFYQEIARGLDGGDLSELSTLLHEAIKIYPNHPTGRLVQAKITERARQYHRAMEEGLEALEGHHWESALDYFQKALRFHAGAKHLRPIITLLSRLEETRRNMDQALVQGDFSKARELAQFVNAQVEEMEHRIPALREPKP